MSPSSHKKVLLIILDGWGIASPSECNAIHQAHTPFFDQLTTTAPFAELQAAEEAVGLLPGQIGTSEVGHMNIGAGRIVEQSLTRIHRALEQGVLFEHPKIKQIISTAKEKRTTIHLLGLVSDGGVHSHIHHLFHLIDVFEKEKIQVFIHAFLDGRDTGPATGAGYITQLQKKLSSTHIRLATLCGRYFAMDRNNNWDRTQIAFDMLVKGVGEKRKNPVTALKRLYKQKIFDEFIPPQIVEKTARIKKGDLLLFFNFRADRMRQIVASFYPPTSRFSPPKNLSLYTMSPYGEGANPTVLFEGPPMKESLTHVLSTHGVQQFRITETEKYAHLTYFFNGGEERKLPLEKRVHVPSPDVATFDLKPEMSARKIVSRTISALRDYIPFTAVNFANADMVGHSGNLSATIKAVQCLDDCIGTLVTVAQKKSYHIIVTADHGNAEYLFDQHTNSPHTAHTTNNVPFFLLSPDGPKRLRESGKLANIAPTILQLMDIPPLPHMSARSLIS